MKKPTASETRREPKPGEPPEKITLGMGGHKMTEGPVRIEVISGKVTVEIHKDSSWWTFHKGDKATYMSPTKIRTGALGACFLLERLPA